MTVGNTYTLVIVDDGTTVSAWIVDDAGQQTCSFKATVSTGNTQVMTGWIGLTAGHTFTAPITGVATAIAATPTFSPSAGTYTSTQTVTISTATTGASIYCTTDGSTPTTASNLYTGAISVSASQTIKAIAALTGLTNSLVGAAPYFVVPWTMEYGTVDGISSGNFALTGNDTGTLSSSAPYKGTWNAATAYQNLGTSNNTISATFTYQGRKAAIWLSRCARNAGWRNGYADTRGCRTAIVGLRYLTPLAHVPGGRVCRRDLRGSLSGDRPRTTTPLALAGSLRRLPGRSKTSPFLLHAS